jgi:hypothetical protein
VVAASGLTSPLAAKPDFGGLSPCLYRQATQRERVAAIVFRPDLQLFVPFAQKDARLEDARLAWRANQGATCFSVS